METIFTEYLHVISDPAHILAELTFILAESIVIGAILTPLIKRWVRRHDEKEHGGGGGHGHEGGH